jgi:hypothetical protein
MVFAEKTLPCRPSGTTQRLDLLSLHRPKAKVSDLGAHWHYGTPVAGVDELLAYPLLMGELSYRPT